MTLPVRAGRGHLQRDSRGRAGAARDEHSLTTRSPSRSRSRAAPGERHRVRRTARPRALGISCSVRERSDEHGRHRRRSPARPSRSSRLATCVVLAVSLRRVRAAQRACSANDSEDLVAHAAYLQRDFEALTDYVHDVATRLDGRVSASGAATRRRGRVPVARFATTPTARCRDASRHRSRCWTRDGRGSCSPRSTTATTPACTQSRCTAGKPELELSPEEEEAVRLALHGAADEPNGS